MSCPPEFFVMRGEFHSFESEVCYYGFYSSGG